MRHAQELVFTLLMLFMMNVIEQFMIKSLRGADEDEVEVLFSLIELERKHSEFNEHR